MHIPESVSSCLLKQKQISMLYCSLYTYRTKDWYMHRNFTSMIHPTACLLKKINHSSRLIKAKTYKNALLLAYLYNIRLGHMHCLLTSMIHPTTHRHLIFGMKVN